MMCESVNSAMALLFVLGFSGVGRSPIVYIYLLEMMTPDQQKIIGPLFAASVGVCLATGTLLFQMLTKDVTLLFYASLGLSFFIMLFTWLVIPESPKYLHATRRYEESRQVLS